eukprot:9427994-Pyramimonas_sp.AAC.2
MYYAYYTKRYLISYVFVLASFGFRVLRVLGPPPSAPSAHPISCPLGATVPRQCRNIAISAPSQQPIRDTLALHQCHVV